MTCGFSNRDAHAIRWGVSFAMYRDSRLAMWDKCPAQFADCPSVVNAIQLEIDTVRVNLRSHSEFYCQIKGVDFVPIQNTNKSLYMYFSFSLYCLIIYLVVYLK